MKWWQLHPIIAPYPPEWIHEEKSRKDAKEWMNTATDQIEQLEAENARLRDIVTRMSRIYKHLNAEQHPGVYFIHGSLGSYDDNGMPEKLLVVPAYGVDFSYIYERTEKTTGPEW
jgi:hypothetical protein